LLAGKGERGWVSGREGKGKADWEGGKKKKKKKNRRVL